ncbi:SDR family oxidoreductase [Rhodococcus opacus]|uniref:SDR family oxidoreductase n=1 Tax=Rhodococcus opacus TaxID=37919 RepID=UPI00352D9629
MCGPGGFAPVFDALGNDNLLDTVALRRFGTAEEIAGVVEFLATDLGNYVSGGVLPIDGGSI